MKKIALATLSTALFASQMVVYPHFAYVKEKRSVQKGIIAPLPKTIIADSLHICSQKGFYIRHRDDLRTFLKKNLKKGERVRFKKGKEVLTGTILSVDPLIIQTPDRIVFKVDYLDIFYKKLPIKGAFEERIELLDRRLKRCEVEYLAGGVSWSSNYTAEVGKKLHLQGYIRIQNSSGYDFKGLKLSVLAGDVRSSSPRPIYPRRLYKGMVAAVEAAPAVTERSVEGYHRYDLSGKWDLYDGDDLWVPYVNEKVSYKKHLRCRCSDLGYNFGERQYRFDQVYEFKAPKALPKGKVRFFGKNTFLGEAFITNRAKDEKIELTIGKEFDLLLKKRVLFYESTKKRVETKVAYSIKNAKSVAVDVELKEHLPYSSYEIQSEKPYKKVNASTIVYTLQIPAKSTLTFQASYIFRK